MASTDKVYISANQQLRDSFRMAKAIWESGWLPDLLIGLWRGGTPIAITIHEYFVYRGHRCHHMPVKCSSYTGQKRTHELQIDFPEDFLEDIHKDSKVLLVDDCFDTGKTAMKMKEILEAHGAETRIATLFWKPDNNMTQGKPDYYMRAVNDWIVFPHELEGLSDVEIARKDPEIADILGISSKRD